MFLFDNLSLKVEINYNYVRCDSLHSRFGHIEMYSQEANIVIAVISHNLKTHSEDIYQAYGALFK